MFYPTCFFLEKQNLSMAVESYLNKFITVSREEQQITTTLVTQLNKLQDDDTSENKDKLETQLKFIKTYLDEKTYNRGIGCWEVYQLVNQLPDIETKHFRNRIENLESLFEKTPEIITPPESAVDINSLRLDNMVHLLEESCTE